MTGIEVSAAILVNDDQILCLQRGENKHDYISYKFEFPGGKLEPGESAVEALSRELTEEMHIELDKSDFEYFMTVFHRYPDFAIALHAYIVQVPSREFDLVEHVSFQWLDISKLNSLDWAGADWPIVKRLMGVID